MSQFIDNFSDISTIGQGSFGSVLKGKLKDGDRKDTWVALKCITLSGSEFEPVRKRAAKEAQITTQFNSESVLKVFDWFEDEKKGCLYLEMEYFADGDLAQAIRIRNGEPFSEGQIRNWFSQMALAVQVLHETFKIVHRDIKPLNIFLLDNMTHLKLGEFGVSKVINDYWLTSNGRMPAGTLQYLSSQVLQGDKPSFKDDIWSLGVVLFELTTLQLPYTGGENPTVATLQKEIQNCKWSSEVNASKPLRHLLQILLHKEPTFRPEVKRVVSHDFFQGPVEEVPQNAAIGRDREVPVLSESFSERKRLSRTQSDLLDSSQQTELFHACLQGNLDAVRTLVSENPEDVEATFQKARHGSVHGGEGWTALMWAVRSGKREVVEFLINEGGAAVNQSSKDGTTALMLAAKYGHEGITHLLVEEAGANIMEKDAWGEAALMKAAWNGHWPIIEYLVRQAGALVNDKNKFGETALMFASGNGHREVVRFLIKEAGAYINEKSGFGSTAVMMAASEGHREVVAALAEKGADVNIKNRDGMTALMWAARQGHGEVVKYLVEQVRAKVDVKDRWGEGALMKAAWSNHRHICEYLVRQGESNLSDRNSWGETALMFAAGNGNRELVEYLLRQGATINDKDNDGYSALMLASTKQVRELLKKYGAKDYPPVVIGTK